MVASDDDLATYYLRTSMSSESADTSPKEPLSVYAVLATFVENLSSVAWSKLGLQPDLITGELVVNLDEAKVAIDATASLIEHLDAQMDEADRRQLQSLIRDLRLNYVSKQREAQV
jgi:hypothetical protein